MPSSSEQIPVKPSASNLATERSALARCKAFLDRIKAINPHVNAYSELLESSALDTAKEQDGQLSRELSGLCAAIKDNVNTVPAVAKAGLRFLSDHRPQSDSTVVDALRNCGAIVLGVTETDSGAFGVTTPQVRNPIYPDRYAGGSSGGSAVAVAADLCDFAIGTDTGGSIRIPAACCGIFGFKPTAGSVPLAGVRPLTISYDHIGPLSKNLDIIKSVMIAIGGEPGARPITENPIPTIAIPWTALEECEPAVLRALRDFAQVKGRLGLKFETVELPPFDTLLDLHISLSLKEAADLYHDISDAQFDQLPDVAVESLKIGEAVSDNQHELLLKQRPELLADLEAVFELVDYLIVPTLPVLPPKRKAETVPIAESEIDIVSTLIRYTAIFNQSGHPVLAFPWAAPEADIVSSLQLIGPKSSDLDLLDFARNTLALEHDARACPHASIRCQAPDNRFDRERCGDARIHGRFTGEKR